jgi:hypothetical protein
MRLFLAALLGLAALGAAPRADGLPAGPAAFGADKPDLSKRHGIDADLKAFPQASPKEAVASVVKAVADKKADYFAAHLADPDFVDKRLKDTRATFAQFVEGDVKPKLIDDPGPLKQIQKFLQEGEFTVEKDRAEVRVKGVTDRALTLRQIDGRWFLENRYQPEEKK